MVPGWGEEKMMNRRFDVTGVAKEKKVGSNAPGVSEQPKGLTRKSA